MSEEQAVSEGVSILSGVSGAEGVADNPNPSTDTEGSWLEGCDEDTVGYFQNQKRFEGVADLAKSYRELEKFRGANESELIRKPKEGESWDDVYTALGRPESASEYVYQPPEGSEAVDVPDSLKEVLFKNGLSSSGYSETMGAYSEWVAGEVAEQANQDRLAEEAEISELKRELGGDLDIRVATADAAAVAMGFDQDAADSLRKSLGVRGMLDVMNKIHDAIGEDKVNNSNSKSAYGHTKEQLINEKNQLMDALKADPNRNKMFLSGGGEDYNRMKQLNESIHA
tara:strand:- start:941 stop:1792 length:852 start_codon:yes stop_codon:yes gene_type:complete